MKFALALLLILGANHAQAQSRSTTRGSLTAAQAQSRSAGTAAQSTELNSGTEAVPRPAQGSSRRARAGFGSARTVSANEAQAFESAVKWLTDIGLISDGAGATPAGRSLQLPMRVRTNSHPLVFHTTDYLVIQADKAIGQLNIYLGSDIGKLRVVSLKDDKLSLQGDAISLEYAANGAAVRFSVTIQVDRASGEVVFRHLNRDARFSQIAYGNLNQLN